jgi:hypothetical protein
MLSSILLTKLLALLSFSNVDSRMLFPSEPSKLSYYILLYKTAACLMDSCIQLFVMRRHTPLSPRPTVSDAHLEIAVFWSHVSLSFS